MTEPDEALIWARERAKADWLECDDETGTLHAAAEDFPSGDSDHFEDIEWRAEAYRAGQAASAERIKALEGLLRECADDLEEEIQARSANDLPRRIERDMEPVKKARALLKEADQ
jgi:Ser/Thr protein kinase RdoA (MazF antagonist)